jgi:hypothetical protein
MLYNEYKHDILALVGTTLGNTGLEIEPLHC